MTWSIKQYNKGHSKLGNESKRKINPPLYIQKITGLKKAYYLKRLRLANQIPIGIEKQYYPLYIDEKLAGFDLNGVTFYMDSKRSLYTIF